MAEILTLATAGLAPEQLRNPEHLFYPRVDYIELQRHFQTDIIDYTAYERGGGALLRQVETHIRSDLFLTWLGLARRAQHQLVFAMSERVGIPFAFFNRLLPQKRPFVSMFTCWSDRQEWVIRNLDLFSAMDGIAVHCESMKQHLINLGAPAAHTHVLPYSIDQHFFTPSKHIPQEKKLIVSIGETRSRDYAALFQAVAGLPVEVQVAAAGMWYAREKDRQLRAQIPDNVKPVDHLSPVRLREWYARAQFVVLPLRDLVYSAGATSCLEAGSMGRAVIAFRSRGITDFVIDGETGILLSLGDVAGMREAIAYLLANPKEARRLGENARQRVEESFNLDLYVRCLIDFLQAYLPSGSTLKTGRARL